MPQLTDGVNIEFVNGLPVATGAGAADAATLRVAIAAGGGGGSSGYTPGALAASAIAVAATAVTVAAGPINGGYVTNPPNAAAQGGVGAAESLYIDMVAAPGSTDAAANGTTSILQPGDSFTLPPLAAGVTVKVNAATAGHKFTGAKW